MIDEGFRRVEGDFLCTLWPFIWTIPNRHDFRDVPG
jgi:hypothetical protein